MPQITVIVPVYNMESKLDKCIKSIIEQTYKDFEIVLIDDGSTDSSGSKCDYYADRYDNIFVYHKKNGGLSDARLTGFRHSTGTYICFVDSDDYIEKDFLKELYQSITEKDSDMAVCSYLVSTSKERLYTDFPRSIYSDDYIIDMKEFKSGLMGKKISGINISGFVWNKIYKRNMIQEDFFKNENQFFLEDHIFNLSYMRSASKISYVPKALYNYVICEQSLTNKYRKNKWTMYKNLFRFMTEYNESLGSEKIDQSIIEERMCHWLVDSLDNATKVDSYKVYRREIIGIMKDSYAKRILKTMSYKNMGRAECLSIIVLKVHLYLFYYALRRCRRFAIFGFQKNKKGY